MAAQSIIGKCTSCHPFPYGHGGLCINVLEVFSGSVVDNTTHVAVHNISHTV